MELFYSEDGRVKSISTKENYLWLTSKAKNMTHHFYYYRNAAEEITDIKLFPTFHSHLLMS